MGQRQKLAMVFFITMAVLCGIIFSAKIIFAAEKKKENIFPERYILYPISEVVQKISGGDKEKPLTRSDEKIFLGLSNNTWRKLSYCAGSAVIGYGAKSKKNEFIGGGVIVVGITLYFDGDKSIVDQFSWGDLGTGVLCGAVGYYVAPAKKESPPSSPPPSTTTTTPGSDPPLGNGNTGGSNTGTGTDPPL